MTAYPLNLVRRITDFFASRLITALQENAQLKKQLSRAHEQEKILTQMVSDTYHQGAKIIESLTIKIDEAAQQMISLSELVATDQLTGLLGRRGLHMLFSGEISAIWRTASQKNWVEYPKVSALFIDADHFKEVNDTLGHAAGDDIIIAIARIMQESFRAEDILCRLGGDEYVVIMPHADTVDASIKAQLFQDKIRTDPRMVFHETGKRITVSIGIAELDFANVSNAGQALNHVLDLADTAMYRAKQDGRDRTVIIQNENE